MASKQPLKLFDVKNRLYNAFLRLQTFVWHTVLRNKRSVIIIGGADTAVFKTMHQKLGKNWIITHLQFDKDSNRLKDSRIKQQHSNQSGGINGEKNSPRSISNFYSQQLQSPTDFAEIEMRLSGQQFNSIIVLPQKENASNCFNIEDEEFVTRYPAIHQSLLMRNILAYRLGSKYLSKTGVVILSCGEREFVKHKHELSKKEKGEGEYTVDESSRKYWPSTQIVSSEISYLGFIIGDRNYLPLNSHSVIALSQEISDSDPNIVSDCYLRWMSQSRLPAAGSFALFRNRALNSRSIYLEYL